MNSSRHANRSGRGQLPSRGRGRGQARGNHNERNTEPIGSQNVPSIEQVTVGAPVSIVLKIDQPTGRQVQGIVAELLTRGNHPRGIKVRLRDGRVGRVQRMASNEEAVVGSAGISGFGRNGEIVGDPMSQASGSSFPGNKYSDFRTDGYAEPPEERSSLADYVVVKTKGKGKGKKQKTQDHDSSIGDNHLEQTSPDPQSESFGTTVCPVCGEFEGDEAAVAHHVNTHFD